MNKLILAGAAALAFTAAPAFAQEADVAVAADGTVYVLNTDQQVLYDAWPVERQTLYTSWPYGVQEYYWTLTPVQADGWWVLTDPQRIQVYEMTPEQRIAAWTQISSQLNNASTTGVVARTAAASASTMGPRFVSGAVVQSTGAADTPATGDLPVCKADQQDNCINSWEKNRTGNRPLEYWPGKPASEIPGKLPATKPGA